MTLQMYQRKANPADPVIGDIPGFIREFFPPECASIVDIYCDPPFEGWKDMAEQKDLPLQYYFSMGCHPHNAKRYDDAVEQIILKAMKHPYFHPTLFYFD
jgi:TatD DNase family protein